MTEETGWRTCERCQGLVSTTTAGSGECIEGAYHFDTLEFSPEYRVPLADHPIPMDIGWAPCTRCSRLVYKVAGGGACAHGGDHQFDEFGATYGVPVVPGPEGAQAGWRRCRKCECLCREDDDHRTCGGGGEHDFLGSLDYAVPMVALGVQDWWRWCSECQGLFHNWGTCRGGSAHTDAGRVAFTLVFGTVPEGTEPGWKLCRKCALLAFARAEPGACYAGDDHEFTALSYSVAKGAGPPGSQPDWRRCGKCQMLVYSAFDPEPCPAGDSHDYGAGEGYSLFPASGEGGQPGWAACGRCGSMTFTQVSHGVCRDGAPHDIAASAAYEVSSGVVPEGGESSWRHCGRCQALVYAPEAGATCFDGRLHDFVDSPLHGVLRDQVPPGAETGWRRCGRCRQLVREGSGVCIGGGAHELGDSSAYAVAVHSRPGEGEEPAPGGPRLTLSESAEAIAVEGTGFGPGAEIQLSFVQGPAGVKAFPTADAGGAFRHVVDQVVASEAGGSVIARVEEGGSATARLHSFFPKPNP